MAVISSCFCSLLVEALHFENVNWMKFTANCPVQRTTSRFSLCEAFHFGCVCYFMHYLWSLMIFVSFLLLCLGGVTLRGEIHNQIHRFTNIRTAGNRKVKSQIWPRHFRKNRSSQSPHRKLSVKCVGLTFENGPKRKKH